MKRLELCVSLLLFAGQVCAQQNKQGALWVDASQFAQADICVDIQAAIATLPNSPAAVGAVIDARNFVPPTGQTYLSCSVNPFSVGLGVAYPSPVVLVAAGYSPGGPTPGSWGGVLLLPGTVIATNVPWLVPQSWSIIGEGSRVSVLAPSSTFAVPAAPSTVTSTAGSYAVSLTGSYTWASNIIGAILMACSSCTAGYQTATVVGIVTELAVSSTQLNLGSTAQVSCAAASPCNYVFQEPLLAWATTNPCASGSCSGALQNNTAGSLIQDLGLDCSTNDQGSADFVPGCLPFWDEYGQERSQLKRIRITNFTGFGIGIYTSNAQNGGPFEDLQMAFASVGPQYTCIEVGGTGVGGVGPMRGVRGLTCTGPTPDSLVEGTGVDINARNFSLSDAHFENVTYGVDIGSLAPAAGIKLDNITGGGKSAIPTATVVNIANTCAAVGSACPYATADIYVSNVYQPFTGAGPALQDYISGNTTTEATLGFYSLGDLGSGAGDVRAVLTTSSSIGSTPNLKQMTSPAIPVTGVQGNGTLVQMSSGSGFTGGDLLQSDGNSNTQDSTIAAGNVTQNSVGGTTNYLPAWTGPHTLANSHASDNGSILFPGETLDVQQNPLSEEATTAGATYNIGDLACVTATNTVGSCGSVTANSAYIGVLLAKNGSIPAFAVQGQVTANSASSVTFTQGDMVCPDASNAAKVIDNGTIPCPLPQPQVGIVLATDSATMSHTIILKSGPYNTISSFSTGAGVSAVTFTSASVTFFGFVLPNAINSSGVVFYVQSAESGYTEDVGIYNSAGTLAAHVGGTSGLFNAVGAKSVSWITSPTTLLPGKYWFAVISTCTSSCGKLGGNATATFQSGGAYSYSGGTLPSSVTLPADSWTIGSVPTFAIH